ncbi:DMT family transporter [Leptolyngbya sp. CCNP1308]|uniref:DMT family transporter n=1 Tax=Leptolyngbya sp. CCNP1308 TaxID=3110255 RepID=UPI002B20CAFF|nr:DMT family transporter [Leptolyngbya sp. CCNP1308]MEA5449626.1 DMT family transporter [Leptolyngbya sp. CCNP1308]
MTAFATTHQKGTVLLLLITVIWGTSFPVLKDTLGSVHPAVLIAVRYSIAAIALLPWLRRVSRQLLRDGALLGAILFAETACALTGLDTISASRSAFIIGLNVIVVPFLGVLMGKQLSRRVLAAAGLAAMGMGAMSWDGGGLSLGDALTLASAVGIAVYIVLLGAIAPRHPSLSLAAVQIWTVVGLGAIWALPEVLHQGLGVSDRIPELVYLGLVVTIGPLWGQAAGQRWVPAHEAALLYTLEPVFATGFSIVLLGEGLNLNGAIGAACILAATVVSRVNHSA